MYSDPMRIHSCHDPARNRVLGWAGVVFIYMFTLAYGFSFITYQTACALGLG